MYRLRILATKKKPWNKGKLLGQKHPLSLKQIWSIRHSLKIEERYRDLALFDLAIDSKLRACDLDPESSAVRDHIWQQAVNRDLDRRCATTRYRIPVSQPSSILSASFIEAILTNLGYVGKESRYGPDNVRDPFNEEDESDTDLQTNQEHSGCAAPPGSFQTGEYCPVSRR